MRSFFVRRARVLPVVLLLLSFAVAQQPATPSVASSAPAYVVIVPVANMYRGPSEDTDVVSQAIYASNVAVVEDKGDWIKVRTADNYTGWTRAAAMKKLADRAYGEDQTMVAVSSLSANIYREQNV